jgi:hypothetical protein
MIRKNPKPPTTQRSFANHWGELDYVCKKINYWLHIQANRARAEHYLGRLERILHRLPENEMAIIREEGWALACELQGKIGDAIVHRRREIQLMERLHKEARSPKYAETTIAYMLRDRDTIVLQHRRAILESLKKTKSAQTGNGRSAAAQTKRPATR